MKLGEFGIRLRLTLWSTAILMLTLVVVLAGTYLAARVHLETLLSARLDEAYHTVASVLTTSGGDMNDIAHLDNAIAFQLTESDGTRHVSQAWSNAALPLGLALHARPGSSAWRSPGDQVFRLQSGVVPEYAMEVTVALDATASLNSVRSLRTILLAAIPCALVLAVLGSHFLAGRALAPITAITRKVRGITAENLSDRVTVSNPRDEIGCLAGVFNDTLARLEDSFERLRRFTAEVSHELRTPLTSIRSTGEVALRDSTPVHACREAISSMLEETDRLAQLVDNLLILARGESGRIKLDRQHVELGSLVGEVVEEMRVLAEEREQTLTFATQASSVVDVDAAVLRRAVANVLHNAIRYAPERGHVEVSVAPGKDGCIVIEVTDDGPGIPSAERERVFERFYRVDEARSRAEGGTGLGLAIARWAVDANGGSIGFRDHGKPGACCRISLPAQRG